MSDHKVHIIGIGDDGGEGLTSTARKILDQAELVLGTTSALSRVATGQPQQVVSGKLEDLVDQINAHAGQKIAILASGDPSGFVLFIIPSVLVSISFAPILLSVAPAPAFETTKPMSFGEIYAASPLGCVGLFLAIVHGPGS